MRGTILHFDETTGSGFITSDASERYTFQRNDISSATPAYTGMAVDFIADGTAATQIFALPQQPAMAAAVAPQYDIEPDLGLWGYTVRALTRDYANFSGRARRKEYWGFTLFVCIIYFVVFALLAVIVGVATAQNGSDTAGSPPAIVLILFGILGLSWLAIIIPAIAVTVRRFHDTGKSGWLYLLLVVLSFIPFVSLVILVFCCLDGTPGANQYGPPVKRTRVYAPN